MSNYTTKASKSKHYTYIIYDMEKDMVYIGVRTSNCPINEDKYMGSSTHKDMIEGLKSRPDDFVKFVIMIFDTRDEAHQHEIDLHNEYDVAANPRFYNKANASSTKFSMPPGTKVSQEARDKMSAAKKGIKQKSVTCPHCGKSGGISKMKQWHFDNCPTYTGKARKGKKLGPQEIVTCPHCGKSGGIKMMKRWHFDNCSTYTGKAHKGSKLTPEQCVNISAALKGKKQKIVTCPHCNKSGGISRMKQWHFDNCPTYTGKGHQVSQDARDKMSASKKDKKQKIVTCPHCDKSGGISSMKRYHFDNCSTYTGKALR
jgi:hypothetical protein